MGLDYSQKRLINAPFMHKSHHGRRGDKLQLYAFLTGLFSTLISLAGVVVQALK